MDSFASTADVGEISSTRYTDLEVDAQQTVQMAARSRKNTLFRQRGLDIVV